MKLCEINTFQKRSPFLICGEILCSPLYSTNEVLSIAIEDIVY